MEPVDLLAAVALAVGVLGVVVPLLPGSLLVALTLVGWAVLRADTSGWLWILAGLTVLGMGALVKYVVAGRHLRTNGVPNRTLLTGGLLGIVGFFVVPVVGLVLGFVGGVYLAEARRLGPGAARASTITAMKAVGLALLVELAAVLLATSAWVAAAVSS